MKLLRFAFFAYFGGSVPGGSLARCKENDPAWVVVRL